MRFRTWLAAALVVAPCASLGAQRWRTLEVGRQAIDSGALGVKIDYWGGKLGIRAGSATYLYQAQLRYDGERNEPIYSFDRQARRLSVGLKKASPRVSEEERRMADMRLDLSPNAPLDLALDLGAVDADLDLSRLRVGRLRVDANASQTRIRFDTANTVPMSMLEVDAGAAGVKLEQLANANARDVRVKARLGGVELDFGGQWTQDIELNIEVLLGGVTIHVPSDVGVRVDGRRFAASFVHEGFVKRGDSFYTENWSSAPRKLSIKNETILGRLEVDRVGR
jgi:hypothetical protein